MLSRLRHLHDLSLGELLIFVQLVAFAAAVQVSLRYLPLQGLLNVLSIAATNRFLRWFPLFHSWSVIPAQAGIQEGGESRVPSGPPLWKRGDRGDFPNSFPEAPEQLSVSLDDHWPRLVTLTNLAARAIRREGPCLLRSLILFWLLKARGEEAELLIGVNKEGEDLQAHAWIETRGTTIGDGAAIITSFTTLVRL